jgi:hypothetical protein
MEKPKKICRSLRMVLKWIFWCHPKIGFRHVNIPDIQLETDVE